MKNALIIVLFTLSTAVSATTYYIDPSGNNANNGSNGSPWKTLAYACSRVTNSGDIIHVNAGTYIESVQSSLAIGVSIEGEGELSNLTSNISQENIPTIFLYSSTEGTNGNQHISNLKLDGNNLTAWGAISVHARSNVSIHDLYIVNFQNFGVIFNGTYSSSAPTNYSTRNSFFNNRVINCSDYVGNDKYGNGMGALMIGGQDGMLIYNNELIQTQRGAGDNGYLIKFSGNGFIKGIKIYNNTITKAPYDGITWDFAIELWNCRGGVEISNNNIQGTIDLGGTSTTDAGGYGFAVKVHNNTIGQAALRTREETGINIELTQTGGLYIYNNLFKNLKTPLVMSQSSSTTLEDLYVYYNIFTNLGVSGEVNSGTVAEWNGGSGVVYHNINFLNNVIYANASGYSANGLVFQFAGNATNVTVRNNIIVGFHLYALIVTEGSINIMSVENNIFYNNGYNTSKYDGCTVTNKTEQNNYTSNPSFVSSSDFHLQSGSMAIGKGLAITDLTTDYAGNTLKNPPSIGAYENSSAVTSPAIPAYQSSVVENATSSLLVMTYDLSLNNSVVSAPSSFNVLVNSVARTVSSVAISGNKVQLTLASAIKSGDIITVSYTKPASNPLQTSSGGQAASISTKSVTNNCKDANKANDPPVVVINYPKTVYAGFISEIDATSTYDPNNDPLVVEWTVPTDVPVSTVKSLKTQVLAPVVDNSKVVAFQLKVSDGITLISNDIQIIVLPYKPELAAARITNIKASDFQPPDYPNNIVDGNTETKWSSNGDNQWLLLTLAGPFKISHLVLAFLQGQQYESYFDIYASKDNLIWEHILTAVASCNFSGARQVFDFPALYTNTEYSYLKYVGHGNSLNNLNIISEIKIFGSPRQNSNSDNSKEKNVIIYPNPARDFLNISIEEPTMEPDKVRIIDLSGKIVFEKVLNPVIKNVQIPISLKSGIYMVDLAVGNLILFAQKLIVRN